MYMSVLSAFIMHVCGVYEHHKRVPDPLELGLQMIVQEQPLALTIEPPLQPFQLKKS